MIMTVEIVKPTTAPQTTEASSSSPLVADASQTSTTSQPRHPDVTEPSEKILREFDTIQALIIEIDNNLNTVYGDRRAIRDAIVGIGKAAKAMLDVHDAAVGG